MDFNFEQRVRKLAAEKKMSLREVERNSGFRSGVLFSIFKHGNPKIKTIDAVASALGVTVTTFVSKEA